MSQRIESILEQALKDSAAELRGDPKMSAESRAARYAAVLDWARWQVAVNGGHWIDYANPFESKLAEAWKI